MVKVKSRPQMHAPHAAVKAVVVRKSLGGDPVPVRVRPQAVFLPPLTARENSIGTRGNGRPPGVLLPEEMVASTDAAMARRQDGLAVPANPRSRLRGALQVREA